MTRSQLVDVLGILEKRYPVEKWRIDDISVWPILKKEIAFQWINSQNSKAQIEEALPKHTTTKNILKLLVSFYHFLVLVLKPKSKVAVIFLGANSHRVVYKNKFINRYFQPIIEHLKMNNQKFISFDYSYKDSTQLYLESESPVFIKQYLPASKVLLLFKKVKIKQELEGFADFIKDVQDSIEGVSNVNFHKLLLRHFISIKHYAFIFDIILKKHTPKWVIGLCYYSNPVYALMYSANKLGINSIDMQHGGQGDLHVAYTNFNKVPIDGFNIMPRTFWCWDSASVNDINKWAKNQLYHKAIISGNPWLNYCNGSDNYNFPNKKIILYTMQFDQVEDYIIEAIENSPADYEWWLRLHPRKLSAKDGLIKILEKKSLLNKVEVTKAIEYPLPLILARTSVHISRFSGSIIEAAESGVKSIIIDKVGAETYEDYINNNYAEAVLNESSHDLWQMILKIESEVRVLNKENSDRYKELINKIC